MSEQDNLYCSEQDNICSVCRTYHPNPYKRNDITCLLCGANRKFIQNPTFKWLKFILLTFFLLIIFLGILFVLLIESLVSVNQFLWFFVLSFFISFFISYIMSKSKKPYLIYKWYKTS